MKIAMTAPRIRLIIADENYKEQLYWLSCVASDLRRARNDMMRSCLVYWQKQIKGEDVPLKDNGKHLEYNTHIRRELTEDYEFANSTLLWEAAYRTAQIFKAKKKDIIKGDCNLPMFKDKSIPVRGLGTEKSPKSKLWVEDGVYYFKPLSLNGIVFKFVNIHKDNSLKVILGRVIDGEYKFGDSQIIKDGKTWYLHMSYSFEQDMSTNKLNPDIVCGVDLGWSIPAVCGLNKGYNRVFLGDSQQLQRFKTQIKNRRKNLSRQRNNLESGHGKICSMKALDRLSCKESNFVKTYNHTISKNIIDFCFKQQAGTIHLEKLNKEVKKNKFLTAYWSYYQLQNMIEYKAKKEGIGIKYIDPAYTSQMCSECGHTARENRKTQSEFVCIECGYKGNADYNAAVNIARSTEVKVKAKIAS
jgi:IS605 OrfB family transposase